MSSIFDAEDSLYPGGFPPPTTTTYFDPFFDPFFDDFDDFDEAITAATPTTKVTDLPVDMICLVFEHLPLAEVLRSASLVCRAFYQAHLQHCRSSVKRLTLLGRLMINANPRYYERKEVRAQNDAERQLELLKYARLSARCDDAISSSSSSSSLSMSTRINPSAVHLKLVPGQEEVAFNAIGEKFKSVVTLELHHLALERHYHAIVRMIVAWGASNSSSGANQLADLKVFFSKEWYNAAGEEIRVPKDSACIAALLSRALTPTMAPALRRLTLILSPQGHPNIYSGNYRRGEHYHGSHHLRQDVDLSQLTAIDAVGFRAAHLPLSLGQPLELSRLRHLTLKLKDLPAWTTGTRPGSRASGVALLRGLRSLAFTSISNSFIRSIAFRRLLAALEGNRIDGQGRPLGRPLQGLQSLTLGKVRPSLGVVLRSCVIPLTTTATATTFVGRREDNHCLQRLRLTFSDFCASSGLSSQHVSKRRRKRAGARGAAVPLAAASSPVQVRFLALTTLHLVKSNLLHKPGDLPALAALFPALAHLRLEGNFRAVSLTREYYTSAFDNFYNPPPPPPPFRDWKRDCGRCNGLIWKAAVAAGNQQQQQQQPQQQPQPQPNQAGGSGSLYGSRSGSRYRQLKAGTDIQQHLVSSTADDCKRAFVQAAEAVWPRLATITLQIEDFAEDCALAKGGGEGGGGTTAAAAAPLKYLFMSETLRLRDPATGEAVPEEERVWTVEKVPY